MVRADARAEPERLQRNHDPERGVLNPASQENFATGCKKVNYLIVVKNGR